MNTKSIIMVKMVPDSTGRLMCIAPATGRVIAYVFKDDGMYAMYLPDFVDKEKGPSNMPGPSSRGTSH